MDQWLIRAICLAALLGGATTVTFSQTADKAASAVTVSPEKLDFGSQHIGDATAAKPVTVTNTRPHPIAVEVLTSGIDFSQTNDCGENLAAGATCTVQVGFKPAVEGPRIGTLTVSSGKSITAHIVVLNGTGE